MKRLIDLLFGNIEVDEEIKRKERHQRDLDTVFKFGLYEQLYPSERDLIIRKLKKSKHKWMFQSPN